MDLATFGALAAALAGFIAAAIGFYFARETSEKGGGEPDITSTPRYARIGGMLLAVAVAVLGIFLTAQWVNTRIESEKFVGYRLDRGFTLTPSPAPPLRMDVDGSTVLTEDFTPDSSIIPQYFLRCGHLIPDWTSVQGHGFFLPFDVSLVPVKSPSFDVTQISPPDEVFVLNRLAAGPIRPYAGGLVPKSYLWQIVAHKAGRQILAIRIYARLPLKGLPRCFTTDPAQRGILLGYELVPILVSTPLFNDETIRVLLSSFITLLGSSGVAFLLRGLLQKPRDTDGDVKKGVTEETELES